MLLCSGSPRNMKMFFESRRPSQSHDTSSTTWTETEITNGCSSIDPQITLLCSRTAVIGFTVLTEDGGSCLRKPLLTRIGNDRWWAIAVALRNARVEESQDRENKDNCDVWLSKEQCAPNVALNWRAGVSTQGWKPIVSRAMPRKRIPVPNAAK